MSSRSGFSLLELLLVVGIIAILFAIVLVALNPKPSFSSARDEQRNVNVNDILNGIYQHALEHDGLPSDLPTEETAICTFDASSCDGYDLSILESYMEELPEDPQSEDDNSTDYTLQYTDDRVYVRAPLAEEDSITVSR